MPISTLLNNEVKRSPSSPQSLPSPSQQAKPDIFLIVFIYLLNYTNNEQKRCELFAKQMQTTASAQVQLNKQNQAINFYAIPSYQKRTIATTHTHWFWHHGLHHTVKVTHRTVWNNNNTIEAYMSKNQQKQQARDTISGKLATYNQISQVQQAQLDASANTAGEIVQEGVGFLDTFKALTNKIFHKNNN